MPDFLFLSFSFFVSFQLSQLSIRLFLSEEVSGYSYCRCWLLINRVPSYQPTHDWLFSTKQDKKKKWRTGRAGVVGVGGHPGKPWDNLNREWANLQDICVCVCVWAWSCFRFHCKDKARETLTLPTPLNTPPTPAECLNAVYPHHASTPAGIKVALCQTLPSYKDTGCLSKGTVRLDMMSSTRIWHDIVLLQRKTVYIRFILKTA